MIGELLAIRELQQTNHDNGGNENVTKQKV